GDFLIELGQAVQDVVGLFTIADADQTLGPEERFQITPPEKGGMAVWPGLLERFALDPPLLQSLHYRAGPLIGVIRLRPPGCAAPRQREVDRGVAEQFRGLLGLPIRRDPALHMRTDIIVQTSYGHSVARRVKPRRLSRQPQRDRMSE